MSSGEERGEGGAGLAIGLGLAKALQLGTSGSGGGRGLGGSSPLGGRKILGLLNLYLDAVVSRARSREAVGSGRPLGRETVSGVLKAISTS